MAFKWTSEWLWAAAIVVRSLPAIAFPTIPELLARRVEVSTPVNSFKRLQEGLFLYERGVSPYDGGVFHQAPLLLPLFSFLGTYPSSKIPTVEALYALLDILNAEALISISGTGQAMRTRFFKSPRAEDRVNNLMVGAAYLFNPFTILSWFGRSTSNITNTAIIHAVSSAVDGNAFNCMLALAVASYLSMYPILLLPPLLLICWDRHSQKKGESPSSNILTTDYGNIPGLVFVGKLLSVLLATLGVLFWTSYVLMGSWDFIPATYGMQLAVPDLTPNIGVWWYFLIEIFDPFRDFFLGVFWLHIVIYVGSLTVRIRRQPLFVVTTLLGIFSVFKPYPSISDVSLYFAFLPLYRHIFPLMRYTFVSLTTVLYATLLGPAFYYLWIYAGSGNANFFYAITLVWTLGLSILLSDSLYAVLRDEWEVERPEMKGRQIRRI